MILDPRGGYNRCKVNLDFFKTWSPQMAYVLGFLFADGNIENAISSRTCYIKFHSKDLEIIEKIKKVLESMHPVIMREPRYMKIKNGKTYMNSALYTLRIGSRGMYQDLIN